MSFAVTRAPSVGLRRELDDAGLARPVADRSVARHGRTEWRLMWRRCDKTGDLPRNNWQERPPYVQLLLPKPAKEPLSDAERAEEIPLGAPTVTSDALHQEATSREPSR